MRKPCTIPCFEIQLKRVTVWVAFALLPSPSLLGPNTRRLNISPALEPIFKVSLLFNNVHFPEKPCTKTAPQSTHQFGPTLFEAPEGQKVYGTAFEELKMVEQPSASV